MMPSPTSKDAVAETSPPMPAPVPVAAAGAAKVGVVLAALVVGVGVVAVRDAAAAAGWVNGHQWIPAAADAVDGLAAAGWMTPAAVLVGILGLMAMAAALAPRRKTALPLTAESAVYLRRSDAADVAAAAAQEVPGVLRVKARSGRGRMVVHCEVTSSVDGVDADAASAVRTELQALQSIPRIVVRSKEARQ